MKLNNLTINQKLRENFLFQKIPKVVFFIPSKVGNIHNRKHIRKEDLAFFKEVKEMKVILRGEGFPERSLSIVPSFMAEVNRIKPILDRLADNGLH